MSTLTHAALREAVEASIKPSLYHATNGMADVLAREAANAALAAIVRAAGVDDERLIVCAGEVDDWNVAHLLRALADAGEART